MLTLDFETKAIEGNTSKYPPKPVGIALKEDGQPGKYLAWGHPSGNNCTREEAIVYTRTQIDLHDGHVLGQNMKFDTSVASEHMRIDGFHPQSVEDTMFLLFLNDPYAKSLSLKPSAERILNWPPDEQDDLHDWILAHVPGATKKTAGAYISEAPASIVAPYAIGDVDRTYALYKHLHPKIWNSGMGEAYEREKKLMPILQRAERHGIRVDMERLHKDLYGDGKGWIGYEQVALNVDDEIRTILGNPNVNIDSGDEFADAVEAAGFAGTWALTPTGRRSTAKGVIEQGIAHPRLVALFRYRQALSTCLSTFMRPWYRMAQATGRMYPNWNQVKNNRNEKDQSGTKTGRLSCNDPNFQNPSNEFTIAIPDPYPALPLVRVYILPDVGCVWLKRDYSQQELRVLAHFAEGDMLQKYNDAPRTDFHSLAAEMIQQTTGIKMSRKIVKIIAFSILYGSGAASMAEQMGCSVAEAQDLKNIYMATFPGIRTLSDELKSRGRRGDYMRTWGGRVYYSEPATLSKKTGRMQEYHYKLLNYLIQGSSADCTKEAVIAYDTMYRKEGTFLLTVHDELDICAPVEAAADEMRRLDKAMQYPGFDVQMLSDGFIGPNWFDLKEFNV